MVSTRDPGHGDWGLGDVRSGGAAPGSSPTGASEGLYGVLQTFVRSPEFGKLITPGRIGDLSQGTNGGIDANRINRGLLGPLHGGTSNYSITATTFAEVDSVNLAGTLYCTGRPVLVLVSVTVVGRGTNQINLSVTMDGTEITGKSNGMTISLLVAQGISALALLTPSVGMHRFALVASVDAGTGTVYSDAAANTVTLAALEL
jgi:hypothetical protein